MLSISMGSAREPPDAMPSFVQVPQIALSVVMLSEQATTALAFSVRLHSAFTVTRGSSMSNL